MLLKLNMLFREKYFANCCERHLAGDRFQGISGSRQAFL